MTGNIQYIDQATYLRGYSPWESLFQFGPPDLIAELPRLDELSKSTIKSNPDNHMGIQILGLIGESIQQYQNHTARRGNVIKALQQDILGQIKRGDLIPFGFKEPRDLNDRAVKIPADLFFTGDINWENSELKYQTYEFKGIRLLADPMPVINAHVTYSEKEEDDFENKPRNNKKDDKTADLELEKRGINKGKHKGDNESTLKSEKQKKQGFGDLDPALHIDEKKAADYLGISHKTLQGYRTKGGGPPFIKIGERAVRYKIADLIEWAESRKKRNTSE